MVKKDIIPSCFSYLNELATTANHKKALNENFDCSVEENLIEKISNLLSCLYKKLNVLEKSTIDVSGEEDSLALAKYYRETVFINMQNLRGVVDELETLISKEHWSLPTYGDLIYSLI